MGMRPNWFIALPVSGSGWYLPLVGDVPHGIRALHAEDLHITVAFLGAVDRDAAMEAWQIALAQPDHAPIQATLGALRPMGNRRRPSAFAATLDEGHDTVAALMADRRDALYTAAGARPDHRPPLPHVTVARPPRRADRALRERGRAWMDTKPPIGASIVIETLALYTWNIDRKSRLFQIVGERRLGG